jgi:4-hydroxy-tetrahydrodipicolinate synthase
VAIKEASGDLSQIGSILNGRHNGFAVYSGDDELALPVIALGGDGCVSVISNALPVQYSALIRAALCGDLATANDLQRLLIGAMRACFVETNPIPIKAMLAMIHMITPRVRLPLTPISAGSMELLRSVFAPFVESMDSVAA